jgi:very-short-patch-repair endonuclease
MTAGRIDGWVARRRLRPLLRGVYLIGPVVTPHAYEMAAALAYAPNAALSHHSATYLSEILPYPAQPGLIDVTVTGRRPGRHPDIRLHRRAKLAPHELREREHIPVTAVPRTLIDLAGCCSPTELEAAVAEAFALRLTNRTQLLNTVRAAPGTRGAARLRALLHGERRTARTRSRPERELLTRIRAAGLPEPEVNVRVGGWEVDLFWRDVGLVVEVDAYATHSSPRAFERDRRKAAELEDLGLTVRRVTAAQIGDQPGLTLARIERAVVILPGSAAQPDGAIRSNSISSANLDGGGEATAQTKALKLKN